MDGIDVEDRLWDPTNSSKFADDAAHHAISEAYMAVFADSAAAEGTTLDELYWPYTAKYDIGVAALEWQRGDIKVLCFRGSYSGGDMSNIPNWFIDFVLEKSTAKLKKAWTEDAGLEWGADQQERESQSTSDLAARTRSAACRATRAATTRRRATSRASTPTSSRRWATIRKWSATSTASPRRRPSPAATGRSRRRSSITCTATRRLRSRSY